VNVVDANVKDNLKLKNNFSNLLVKKIEEIHKIVKDQNKPRSRIDMITRRLLHHQIIVPIYTESVTKIMAKSSKHVTNINCLLKNIKSNVVADFIQTDSKGIIVITNSIAAQSNLDSIENYIKDINTIQVDIILISCLF